MGEDGLVIATVTQAMVERVFFFFACISVGTALRVQGLKPTLPNQSAKIVEKCCHKLVACAVHIQFSRCCHRAKRCNGESKS